MSESDEVKNANATFEERALDWHERLSDEHKEEVLRQAYLKFNVDRLQPKRQPTDKEIAGMSDQELERYKRSLGL